jgi:hypothetical protein
MEATFTKVYTGTPEATFAQMEDWVHAAIPGAKGSVGHLMVELGPDDENNAIVLTVKGPPEHVKAYMAAFGKVSGVVVPAPKKSVRHANTVKRRPTWRRGDPEYNHERDPDPEKRSWLPLGHNENTIGPHRPKVNAVSTRPVQGLISFLSDEYKVPPSVVRNALIAKRAVQKELRYLSPGAVEKTARNTFEQVIRSHKGGGTRKRRRPANNRRFD